MPDTTQVCEARKYAMTRISAGDWLLPSNDGRTLWRVVEYVEDGCTEVSADGKKWHKLTGKFWAVWKYRKPLPDEAMPLPDDFLEWEQWEQWDSGLLKRKYAVEAALRRG